MERPETPSQRPPRAAAARRNPAANVEEPIVEVGDIPVLLRFDGGSGEAGLQPLSRLRSHPGPPAAEVTVGRVGPLAPDRPPDRSTGDIAIWHEAGALVLRHYSDTTARVHGTTAEIGGGHGDRVYAVRRLLHLVLTHLLAPLDRFVLHGGALLHRRQAYLALGDTGTGKSTLAVAALSAGWGVLADDLVVLRDDRNALEVAGIPRPVAVPGDALDSIAALRPIAGDPRGRHELAADVLAPGWWPVTGSLVLGHSTRSTGELRRLPAHDVLPQLVGAFLASGDALLLRRYFPLAGALSRRPAWELRHGAQPAERLAVARTLLAAVVAAS